MAYSLNRRCGPGSGIRHAPPKPAPITPKPTEMQRAIDRALKRVLENARKRGRALRTQEKQRRAAKRYHAFRKAAGRAPSAPGALARGRQGGAR